MTRARKIYLAFLAVILSPTAANAALISIEIDSVLNNTSETYIMPVVVGEELIFEYVFYWSPMERLSPPVGSQLTFYNERVETQLSFGDAQVTSIDVNYNFAAGFYSLLATAIYNTPGNYGVELLTRIQSVDFYYFSSSSSSTDFTNVLSCLSNILFGCVETTTTQTVEIAESKLDWELQFSSSFEVRSVPEPGTLALLGLGLVGMAARRKKKV